MSPQVISQILKLNDTFYQSVAESFSKTRQNPWLGWLKVKSILKEHFHYQPFSIYDFGCGNGRFYDFIKDLKPVYVGFDNNDTLLSEAKLHGAPVKKLDVIQGLDEIKVKFDCIVAFGLHHHIPSAELRKKWISDCINLLKPGGIFIVSIWHFDTSHALPSPINQSELEDGDYFLDWEKSGNARFYHQTSEEEIAQYHAQGRFEADGKNKKSNTYLVFRA